MAFFIGFCIGGAIVLIWDWAEEKAEGDTKTPDEQERKNRKKLTLGLLLLAAAAGGMIYLYL